MSNEYRNNHYVPQWYQKRFIPEDQNNKELYYLNLNPGSFVDPRGIKHTKRALHKQGTKFCFAQNDLYTTWFGAERRTGIEQVFFGQIDSCGREAVEFFANYKHLESGWDGDPLRHMMLYMSTQKLRTPKGLDWLAKQANTSDRDAILQLMLQLRQLHSAIWVECVWQISEASQSDTKFIISDHPVTVYNKFLGPRNKKWCRGSNDPDITLNATHTVFPLSLDKVLILTNLSWVRNPYQSGVAQRPNANPMRQAMFNFQNIQTMRQLSEHEVLEINFIIKSRAYKYIAAVQEDWLYPENHVSKSNWNTYGDGLLLMPDPRGIEFGGEMFIGWEDGTSTAFDEYGRRPWQQGYGQHAGQNEFNTLYQFKGDFAAKFGPYRRGRGLSFGTDVDPEKDTEDMHEYHLSLAKKNRRKKC